MRCFKILCLLSGFVLAGTSPTALLRTPDPHQGILTAWLVPEPSRAALDFAAYINNSLLESPGVPLVDTRSKFLLPTDLKAKGLFTRIELTQAGTGMGALSLENPYSYAALKRATTIELKWDALARMQKNFSQESGLRPVALYIKTPGKKVSWKKGPKPSIWIEVQLAPGAKAEGLKDLDGDGVLEYFGLVDPSIYSKGFPEFLVWLKTDYAGKILDSSQILDWAQNLSSYWYPSYNTDLVWDLPAKPWPQNPQDSIYKALLKKGNVKFPTIVIRGNPLGLPHFTVLSLQGVSPLAQRSSDQSVSTMSANPNKLADRQLPVNYMENMERIGQELAENGESFKAWESNLAPYTAMWRKLLDSLHLEQAAFVGQNQWLFFRRSLASMLGGDVQNQDSMHNPLPPLIDFKGRLEAREVNMLFVPVPMKTEVYPDLLPGSDSTVAGKIVNPWMRKFVRDAQDEGMELIDLLPEYLQVRRQDPSLKDPLYQKDDTHWTTNGMLIAAEKIANRIKQYAWYPELKPDPSKYKVQEVAFNRLGDLVERLPSELQVQFPAMELQGKRVFVKDSVPYAGGKGAPILLIGDSFTGVMESVDCRNAGIGSHIARLTGLDVEVITSWGGGPNVRGKFLRVRNAQLDQARLVIYLMTARDLFGYPEGWERLEQDQQ